MVRWKMFVLVALFACPTWGADPPPPDFARDARPFLEKHCLGCHGAKDPKAELALDAFRDSMSVVRQRKVWDNVLKMVSAGEMPPKEEPRPTVAEIEQFVSHVKAVFDHADRTAKPDPGRVTMRRLNRREYANTVRELLGADFNPTEDFPADDVGYGFDNIGDVLSLSPLLMERYLDAAERIVERVIVVNPPAPAKRYLSGRFLQPNNANTPQGRFRPMNPASAEPTESGPFAAPADYMKFTGEANLIYRANLYAEPKGPSPVKVVLFISGKDLKDVSPDADVDTLMGAALNSMKPLKILGTFEITAREPGKLQQIEVPLGPISGIQRAGIAVIKPPEGEEPPLLHVENLWSEGPLDTRPASHRKILACAPDKPQAEQTREVLTRLATRAYRRPATPAEVEALAKFADRAVADGQKWEAGIQLAIQAMLCSPKFLFRVELDSRSDSPEQRPIDEFQLASRLSYFLWSTMPDDELFGLAQRSELTANLEPQVRRMLKDPRAGSLIDDFVMQWLQLGKLQTLSFDAQLFPTFSEPLRQAMLAETRLTALEVLREDRSLLDLIQSDFTYLNETLAKHYGIVDTLGNRAGEKPIKGGLPIRGPDFVRVSLTGSDRGGLLTQASILAVNSNPTRTSPVKRGRWVLEQILGTPPPPPPPNVPQLEQQKEQLTGSLRQRMEQHRKNPACANCHAQMDAMGFAFENYDAIGAFRKKDGEFDIDSSATLPDGRTIQGPSGLREVLLERKELFARSLSEKMLTYAIGRGVEYYDKRPLDGIVSGLAADNYKFSRLVIEIVRSDPFRMRRGKDN